jgi:hypothetical protein
MSIQVRSLRSVRHIVALGGVVALLTVLGSSPALGAEAKPFTAVKLCSGLLQTTPLTQTCLITQSSTDLLLGGTVHYQNIVFSPTPPGTTNDHLTSPVLFTAVDPARSTATGQCTFYIAGIKAGTGHCEYWTGTRRLREFHAAMAVGTVTTAAHTYTLTGSYWFG